MREINETWTLGGLSIAVQDDSLDYPIVRMGRLEPLEHNYSIGHYGGTESAARDIKFTIFSGYDDNLIPLVGSGYHALVSDQGEEGDYFIVSIRGERLQALNKLSSVFKVTASLKKESYQAPPIFPGNVYIFLSTSGVYFTDTFGGATVQVPTWTAKNGGLPNTSVRSGALDQGNPSRHQYLLLQNGEIYTRDTNASDNWSFSIAGGNISTPGTLRYILAQYFISISKSTAYVDSTVIDAISIDWANPGHIYVQLTYDYSRFTSRCGQNILRSTDYGQNWSWWAMPITNDAPIHGQLWKSGNYAYVGYGSGGSGRVYSSNNGGSSWVSASLNLGFTKIAGNPWYPDYCYGTTADGVDQYTYKVAAGSSSKTYLIDRSPSRDSGMFFSPTDANKSYMLHDRVSRTLYRTEDDYNTTTGQASGDSVHFAPWTSDVADNFLIFATNAGTPKIYAADGDDITTFYNKTGSLPTGYAVECGVWAHA